MTGGGRMAAGTSDIQAFVDVAKKYRLLTREQEVELARAIRKGQGAKAERERVGKDGMSKARWRELGLQVHLGETARESFMLANLRLVLSIASRFKSARVPLPDLVQEGNIGLMRALEKYDPERGFKFSTYASWWIRQAMMRASQVGDEIRIPVHRVEVKNQDVRAQRLLEVRLGRPPTPGEVAAWIGVSEDTLVKVRAMPHASLSLDEPLNEDADAALLGSVVEDASTEDAETAIILRDMYDKRDSLLEGFTPRERDVLRMRFDHIAPKSLEEIGTEIGVTRERVRQILLKCETRLRLMARQLRFFG